MQQKYFLGLAGLATTLGLVGFVAPAQALSLGIGGIQFDQQTQVNFTLINSQGAYTSALKVVEDLGNGQYKDLGVTLFSEMRQSDNRSANDWLGTCGEGKAIANCNASFTFESGIKYSFLLDSGRNGKVFSTSALNTKFQGSQQAKFFDDADQIPTTSAQFDMRSFLRTNDGSGNVDPFSSPVFVAFDDRGAGNDKDFNDFKFTMQAVAEPEAVPEPVSTVGIGLVAGAFVLNRRRDRAKAN